jgi:formylglycine-generating enzyme required for sulfatase activity
LSVEPDNARARDGVDQIVATLTEQARTALNEGREFEVFELMPLLFALAPDSEGVTSLRAHLELLREVEDILVQAQAAKRDGRLIRPRKASALKYYRDALALDPLSREAQFGIAAIEQGFLDEALAAAHAGKLDAVAEALAKAATVQKTSPARAAALAQIDALKTSRQRALLDEAQTAIDLAQGALAQDRIERAEKLGASREETALLRREVQRIFQFSRYQLGQVFSDLITTAGEKGPEMVVLPTGGFRMGSEDREKGRRKNEGPAHDIVFPRGVALKKTEVSVGEFERFVRATGYVSVAEREGSSASYDERGGRIVVSRGVSWRDDYAGKPAGATLPVVHVAFDDALAYAAWLSEVSGQRYRLPSEAEFEYALRAGSDGRFWWGNDSPTEPIENLTGAKDRSRFRRTWSEAFAGYGDGYWGPAPVASFKPNPFGLYDMAGNVSEWVADCWHDSYVRAPADGSPWVNPGCDSHVVRGGSWGSAPLDVRSAYRAPSKPATRSARTGFRVVRELVGS